MTPSEVLTRPETGPSRFERAPAPPISGQPERSARPRLDDWPHTSRLLPWLIAAFLVMLWLIPFNTIKLQASGPIDLQLDRLMLPAIAAVWLVSVVLGGSTAARPRFSPAHVAFVVFFLISALSIVVNARMLNFSQELGGTIKQLSVVAAYLTFFVMITSIVRPSEVRAFIKLTFALAVLCALGTLWEYNMNYNVFYGITSKLPAALFSVQDLSSTPGVDEIGRRLTRGPAQHGLEDTTMLAMGLPVALVGLMHSQRRLHKVIYALAACIILAAAISTYKKTAIVGPIAGIAVLIAFRPRRLLRLAPLGLVILVVIHALSPGALGSVVVQFGSHRLNSVTTVSDRTNDYDAVRPDVLSHPILGRGYGAYSEARYRILDNQFLGLLVMVGFAGVAAFAAIMITVIVSARRPIRSRDPMRAPPALIGASAAAVFLTVSFLFDSMAFPHAPYVFLSLAGLAAAATMTPKAQT